MFIVKASLLSNLFTIQAHEKMLPIEFYNTILCSYPCSLKPSQIWGDCERLAHYTATLALQKWPNRRWLSKSHRDRTRVLTPTKNVSSFETLNFVVYGPHFCSWLITKKQYLIKFCGFFYNQNSILTIGRDNDRTLLSLLRKKLKMSYSVQWMQ